MVTGRVNRAMTAAALAMVAASITPRVAEAHPLHTTFVELTFAPQTATITATVKVFADDFLRRASRGTTVKPNDDAALQRLTQSYLAQTFQLNASSGELVPLRFCGWKRSADLIFICMSGQSKRGIAGLKIRDAILADVFTDQVNVFQAEYGGQRHSLLFLGGAGTKQLP